MSLGRSQHLVALAFIASGCAILTGIDEYGVGGASSSSGGALLDGGSSGNMVVVPSDGGPLPLTCTANQVACTGTIANACVGNAWKATPCDETCVDGVCQPFLSCRNAMGAGCGTASLSCCASRPLPGGMFNRRNDTSLPATIGPFDLDVFEVTVARFRAFVAAGGATQAHVPTPGTGAHPKLPDSGWHAEWNLRLPADIDALTSSLSGGMGTWTPEVDAGDGAHEHLPINNVNWLLAFAFCAWDGGRLATFAELSFAATGGDEQRVFPWSKPGDGTAPSSDSPAVEAAFNCNFKAPQRTCPSSCTGCDDGDIAPVGSLPAGAGKWDQLDLAGNVAEFALDLSDPPGDARPPVPCNDCAVVLTTDPEKALINGHEFSGQFFLLGGAYDSGSNELRADKTDHRKYDEHKDTYGIRCARNAR